MFGKFIKERRMALGLTLRAFCLHNGEDPSNWSKLERGIMKPPSDETRLKAIAKQLNLSEEKEQDLIDLAYADAGRVPPDIMNDTELLQHLPVIFRSVRSEARTEAQLRNLVELIRKAHTPE